MRTKLKKYAETINGKVLDIGCGNMPYKNIFKNVENYIGTNSKSYYDNSLKMPTEQNFIVEDGTNLPFDDLDFDAVLNFQVLPVMYNPNDFFKEVSRVLKPKGTFLLTTDFMYPIWNAPFNFWRTTKYGLEKLAQENNFEVIALEPFGGYWIMQARNLERYSRSLLTKLISLLKTEKNPLIKVIRFIVIIFWLLFILISPVVINFLFFIFHILDYLMLDEDFTTNYLIIVKKK